MGVARVGHPDPRGVVQVPLAVRCHEPGSLAVVDDQVRDAAPDRRYDGSVGEGARCAAADAVMGLRPHGYARRVDGDALRERGDQRRPPTAIRKMIVPITLTWGGHADAVLGVDEHREGLGLARREVGDHEVVDRQAEREQGGRDDPGRISGNVTFQKVWPLVRVEVHRRLLEVAREAGEPGADGDHHEADVEHDVRDQDRDGAQREERLAADRRTNMVSSEAPRTISGVAIGRKISRLLVRRSRKS